MRRVAVLVPLVLLLPVLLAVPSVSAATDVVPNTITMTTGTNAGLLANLADGDGVGETLTEANTGGTNVEAWDVPNGVGAGEFDFRYGCIAGVGETWRCVDEIPVNDGNTTYVSSQDRADVAVFGYPAWSHGADVTILWVSTFMWFRKNQSTDADFTIKLTDSTGACAATDPIESQAFTNGSLSVVHPLACDGVTDWTVPILDSTTTMVTKTALTGYGTVTSVGRVVLYDDADYTLSGRFDWTGLPALQDDRATLWMTATITDAGDNFDTQALGCDGTTWTTLTNSIFGGASVERRIDVSNYICNGGFALRVVDDDNTGEDQAALLMDRLLLEYIPEEEIPGSGLKRPVISCDYSPIMMTYSCRDTQDYGILAVEYVEWWLGNPEIGPATRIGESAPDGGIIMPTRAPWYSIGPWTDTISAYAVYHSGAKLLSWESYTVDNWPRLMIWLLLLIVIVILIAAYLHRRWEKRHIAKNRTTGQGGAVMTKPQHAEAHRKRRGHSHHVTYDNGETRKVRHFGGDST